MSNQDMLIRFAKEFEPVHQVILKRGGASISEYSKMWHIYYEEIRPTLFPNEYQDGKLSHAKGAT